MEDQEQDCRIAGSPEDPRDRGEDPRNNGNNPGNNGPLSGNPTITWVTWTLSETGVSWLRLEVPIHFHGKL